MTSYVYEDEDGDPVYRVVRRDSNNGKSFYQQHYNGSGWTKGLADSEAVPYHLPLILEAIERGEEPIWIFEGEKDVDNAIKAYRIVATTNSGGSGKWRDNHSRFLRGAERAYICYDNDEEGYAHAWAVHDSLQRHGISDIRFRRSHEGKDITDHINAGWRLRDLIRAKPPRPDAKANVAPSIDGHDSEGLLPAAFQLALIKLRERGPVQLEDRDQYQYNALCPAHDDKNPSLTIRPGSKGDSVSVLVHCFAGCEAEAIALALGLPPGDFTKITDRESAQDKANRRMLIQMKARRWATLEEAKTRIGLAQIEFKDVADTGETELKIPLEPAKWVIEGWKRYSSGTLLVADPKAGKTRLCLNLMQALSEGTKFLGKFATSMPEGSRVCYLNYDMPDNLFREYLHDYQWSNPSGMVIHHLNGGQFPFWVPEVFEDFVQYALRMNIQFLVFDTLQVAMQGFVTDENSNTEIGEFVAMIRKLCKAASIPHFLVVHHRGKSPLERGRGASTLDAAFDGLWFLRTADQESHDSPRSLKAKGRGVRQGAIELVYDLATEVYTTELTSTGEGKALSRFGSYCKALKVFYDENGGWPRGSVVREKLMSGRKMDRLPLMREAEGRGLTVHFELKDGGYEVRLTAAGVAAVNK